MNVLFLIIYIKLILRQALYLDTGSGLIIPYFFSILFIFRQCGDTKFNAGLESWWKKMRAAPASASDYL